MTRSLMMWQLHTNTAREIVLSASGCRIRKLIVPESLIESLKVESLVESPEYDSVRTKKRWGRRKPFDPRPQEPEPIPSNRCWYTTQTDDKSAEHKAWGMENKRWFRQVCLPCRDHSRKTCVGIYVEMSKSASGQVVVREAAPLFETPV
jgi:hypothetical protein